MPYQLCVFVKGRVQEVTFEAVAKDAVPYFVPKNASCEATVATQGPILIFEPTSLEII